MTKNNDETFVKITIKDVWNDMRLMHKKVDEIRDLAKETNGKVKFHQKLIYSLGTSLIIIIGWLLTISLRIPK